ncbi:MAG TPA: hypothetical protein VFO77_01210 [Actinoplanes sp.]|nr:hypothetical protein [Actinoplanes sp.]
MHDLSAGLLARFRPTWQQALARGVYLGVLVAIGAVAVTFVVAIGSLVFLAGDLPPVWVWASLLCGPPVFGGAAGLVLGRRVGADIEVGGIRLVPGPRRSVEPWSGVVDLRAERRGARTVVSVYLESGAAVRLRAPYDGELLAADPLFERKLCTLAQLWRSHRFGGLPG